MPNARARLDPTTSMTVAPTTARTIWVSITGADRGGVPRRRGRNASAAPSAVAMGRESTARSTMSRCDSSTCGSDCVSSGGKGCMSRVGRTSACRLIDGARTQRTRVVDLLFQLRNVPVGIGIGVVGGAKRIVPLPIGESLQMFAGPSHVGGMDHGDQLLVTSEVIERDLLAVDPRDEPVLL